MTQICVIELPIIGSDNGLSPGRHQAIIWTNAGMLLIRTLGINFSEIWSEIHTLPFNKMYLKMSSGKRRQFRLGLNVLNKIPVSASPINFQFVLHMKFSYCWTSFMNGKLIIRIV